eukprot:GHVR01028524.1.p1 GENE.GHVR01028524.1~~GHVR01028524.1.p1  ORF type:complete len:720 (+),score=194.97 GHVR01028524.1:56-2215(+)
MAPKRKVGIKKNVTPDSSSNSDGKSNDLFVGIRVFFSSGDTMEDTIVSLLNDEGATIDKRKSRWGKVDASKTYVISNNDDIEDDSNPIIKLADKNDIPIVVSKFFVDAKSEGDITKLVVADYHPNAVKKVAGKRVVKKAPPPPPAVDDEALPSKRTRRTVQPVSNVNASASSSVVPPPPTRKKSAAEAKIALRKRKQPLKDESSIDESVHDSHGDSGSDFQSEKKKPKKEPTKKEPIKKEPIKKEIKAKAEISEDKKVKKEPKKAVAKKKNKKKEDEEMSEESEKSESESEAESTDMTVRVVHGGAAVDSVFAKTQGTQYRVVSCGNEVWDAMLNQSNLDGNNNKFYICQILTPDGASAGSYTVWFRWGRIGVEGQNSTMKTPSLENAKNVFRKKFTDKTGNHWQGNASKTFKEFRKVPGKYQLIELDFSPDEENKKVLDAHEPNQIKMPDSTLHPKVLGIVELIFDINMMTSLMMEIGYDAKKMPLGKLSKTMIKSGFSILKQIESILNGKSTDRTQKLKTLTSEFYTIIPHDFGFKKMGAFVIDTAPKLKEKLHMVESLGEIEIAQKILKEEDIPDKHPADQHYEKLKTELKFIELDSEEFDMIRKYLENTHGCTHTCWRVRLTNLFRVDRQGEVERFSKSPGRENRMLLWHGSRLTNYVGILSQGLRIAPPEAPCTGYMFDKGVYFADTSSKSAQYCFPSHTNVLTKMHIYFCFFF